MIRPLLAALLLTACSGDDKGESSANDGGGGGLTCPEGQVRTNDGQCHGVEPPPEGGSEGEGEGEGEAGGGEPEPFDSSPWNSATCPPRSVITSRLCTDPVTSCICSTPPVTCREGFKCLGGACFPPGQRSVDECSPDRNPGDVVIDLGAAPGGVSTARGEVNVERTADGTGWALFLPTSVPGGAFASVRVQGDVEPPVQEGDVVDVTVCRHHTGGETLKVFVDLDILLFATNDATYTRGDDCIPPGFKPQVLDLNCPPTWHDGDEALTACRSCISPGLQFGGGRPTLTGQTGWVMLDDKRYAVVAGMETRDCQVTCCNAEGKREHIDSKLDYALIYEAPPDPAPDPEPDPGDQ